MVKASARGGGRSRPQPSGKGKGKKPGQVLSEDMYDEVDTFNMNRDKIKLDAGETSDTDEESEPEALLDLPDFEEESSEEDDDSGEEDRESDEDEDDDTLDDKAWGKKKSIYYSTDYIDEDLGSDFGKSDEDAEEEEKEALRMQKEQAQMYEEDDFFGAPTLAVTQAAKDRKRALADKAAVDELEDVKIGRGAEIVTISRDVAGLTRDEKLELLMNESPELLELLSDFRDTVAVLKSELQPVVSAGHAYPGRASSGKHADYVDTKYMLLLNYCVNISYYLLLKSRGKAVKDHPVIRQLIEQRELIGKLRAVDNDVARQVADLRAAIANGPVAMAGNTEEPAALRTKHLRSVNPETAAADRTASKKGKKSRSSPADDGPRTLTSDVPLKGTFAKPSKVVLADAEFVPGEGKKRNVVAKGKKGALSDYGEGGDDLVQLTGKKRARAAKLEHVASKAKPREMRSVEVDVPRKLPKDDASMGTRGDKLEFDDDGSDGYDDLPASKKANRFEFNLGDDMAGEDKDELDDYYNSVREGRKKRKADRDAAHQRVADYLPEEEAEEKRGINWQIQKNKGLTPHRKVNNPRVKHKLKFAKAKVKRKHQVKQHTPGAAGSYGGEASGLKKNLARSVRL